MITTKGEKNVTTTVEHNYIWYRADVDISYYTEKINGMEHSDINDMEIKSVVEEAEPGDRDMSLNEVRETVGLEEAIYEKTRERFYNGCD